uniref:Receptor protein-tyrosine kinase n=1 Tax=Corethrella appendiculata TaxID=1370023 RepID=W4VRP0_9DIPT
MKMEAMVMKTFLFILIFTQIFGLGAAYLKDYIHKEDNEMRVCIGTNGRMSVPSNREYHYKNLRDRYTNCTYVDGNLEVTWIQNDTYDLSFLQHIREVTGYVLISHVDIPQVILPKLQIIRGRTTFKLNIWDDEFGLFVSFSQTNTLELPALRDILSGSAGLFNNYNLCHIRTINWDEIISGPNASLRYTYNFTSPERDCPPCHSSCEGGCWGEGAHNCQKFSKINCSPQCSQGRCFGPKPRDCCHLFCAGGCTGPTQKDCLACRNFYDDGVCKQECPPMQIYNPTNYLWEPNPNGKYAYGATCVRNCPEHLLKDNGACVRTCPPNKMAQNGECVPCNGACPKTCPGEGIVHSGNIDSYKGCTIIEGSLEILDQTFDGFQQVYSNFSFGPRYIKIHPDRLEVFSTLKEITGYINIQGYHEHFTNLSYFRNLEIVGGRQLKENLFASLYIVKTSLRSLEMKSLKRVNSGAIVILENKHLCFADGIDWTKIKKSTDHESVIGTNRGLNECRSDGFVCSEQCTAAGCWGKGTGQCLECKNFNYKETCLANCRIIPKIYQANAKTCSDCHSECLNSCSGPNADNCFSCAHVKDGKFCVSECPFSKYPQGGVCVACHETCIGCNGPRNTIAPDGCVSCNRAIINGDATVEKCLLKNETCPVGYYVEWVMPQEQGPLKALAGKAICRKCHPRCKKCTGYGFHEQVCSECTGYKRGEQCEDECPTDHYANEANRVCVQCHTECRGCYGSGEDQCIECRNYKIYGDGDPYDNTTSFNCTATCPPEFPHKIFQQDKLGPYCSATPINSSFRLGETAETPLIMIIILSLLFLLLCILIASIVICKQKNKKDAVKMTMVLTGCDDSEPLRPTTVGPNLTKFKIIKESELRRGCVLGMGAFGRVFKGVWITENVANHPSHLKVKIPVAIKVLTDISGSESSKEFLDEAYIMASVEHPNLLNLLAVCMSSELMLITQLMPLGCLLEYVRINKDKIGSCSLLTWSKQIALGMAYLEEHQIVHRDLAARNVLVHNPWFVKITDFGLAKLLDYGSDEYRASGGKMPIKWLALECIRERIFTNKSDVWAFGVTIWELLTYGQRPYENIPAKDVPQLIEEGLKLPQPEICSLDLYVVLLRCWSIPVDSRPKFSQLVEIFSDMAKDPQRFLSIPGDKNMRLPLYTNKDEKDLIRTLASHNVSGVTETEDYLQPRARLSAVPGPSSADHCKDLSRSLRYGRDPMKTLDDEIDSSGREIGIGGLRLDLPLDEDDYLMPTVQQSTATAPGYMDLIGLPASVDNPEYLMGSTNHNNNNNNLNTNNNLSNSNSNNSNKKIDVETIAGLTTSTSAAVTTTAAATATVSSGTTATTTITPATSTSTTATSLPLTQLHQTPPTQTIGIPVSPTETETTSEHEYYNDLQRELQPLHRNETTV